MGVIIPSSRTPSRDPKPPYVVLVLGVVAIAAAAIFGRAHAQQPADREQKLQESIDRLTGQREQVRQELIAAKQELRAIQAELATTTNEITITIKLSIPPCAHKPQVKVEQE